MSTNNALTFRRGQFGKPDSYVARRIPKLAKALGWDDVSVPSTRSTAYAVMRRLERALSVENGGPIPKATDAQLATLRKLRPDDYFAPETYDQADAMIKQLIAPSAYQLHIRDNLIAELGWADVPFPETEKAAGSQIHRMIAAREDALGYTPATTQQLVKIRQLAEEQGREPYKEPRTRDEADALIRKVTAAIEKRSAKAEEPLLAA